MGKLFEVEEESGSAFDFADFHQGWVGADGGEWGVEFVVGGDGPGRRLGVALPWGG